MSRSPKIAPAPAAPRRWPLGDTERIAVKSLLGVIEQVNLQLAAVWRERAKREGLPPTVDARLDPKSGAWVEAGG